MVLTVAYAGIVTEVARENIIVAKRKKDETKTGKNLEKQAEF